MDKHIIYGVHVSSRPIHIPQVQSLFTEYGCYIKTRLGLHEVHQDYCSPNGLIILEMYGDEAKCKELYDKLNMLNGVECKSIVFEHSEGKPRL